MSNFTRNTLQPKITKDELVQLVNKCQERTFSEDIDFIQEKGGAEAFPMLLGVDYDRGIDSGEVSSRRQIYGSNHHEEIPMKTFFELMKTALEDFTLRVLLVAAAVSVTANMIVEKEHREIAWIEGFTIFMAVMICSSVTALNDLQKEKQFRKLNEVAISKKTVNVWRDGRLISVHESELVTGDIVQIAEGMYLNADMMILQAFDVTIDESALTGEPDPIRKKMFSECLESKEELTSQGRLSVNKHSHTYSPIMMSGTTVLTGEGKAVVLVVGEDSCIGRIRSLVQQEAVQTPLQQKLEVIAEDIGKFGLVSAIITLVILLLRFLADRMMSGTLTDFSQYVEIVNYIIIAITVVVVAIPEGLPLAVTLSLAYSMQKMLQDRNLVRRLEATETMGGANNICSDKTGTLTQNKMTLTAFWNARLIPIDGYKQGRLDELFPQKCHDLIRQALACNSSATLNPIHGNRTEICLLEFLERYGEDYENLRRRYVNDRTIRFPFSSHRKRMSTVLEIGYEGNSLIRRIHTKGASEIILSTCSSFYDFDEGKCVPITETMRKAIEDEIENMADQALRTLCVAYKDIGENEDLTTRNSSTDVFNVEEENFVLLGVLGVKDILKREVKVAIAECKAAGIKVRMVTGDNKITAKAIAKECGIIDPYDTNSLVMTGPEFMERIGGVVCKNCMTKECDCPKDKAQAERKGKEVRVDTIANGTEFDKIYQRLDVLARSRPEDKYALVTGLMERGAVVAVTGDGTNDAPALKKADVGFAMNSGTDVAKEAADIILIDDNFASIVESVKWGRNIYDNIRKFLQFQLTVNVVAVGITLIGAAILKEAVFTAVQLLWMNLIMDTLASLALATESPHDQILGKKPYDRNEYILSNTMRKHIIGQAIYQFIIIIFLIFTGDLWVPESLPKDELEGTDGQLKYYSDSTHIRSGRSYFVISGDYDYEKLESILGPSRHFTMVFNTFVFLQVFNFLNCRKLNDERNIFKGITRNPFFLSIVSLITVLQILIINFGGLPMSVSYHGLDLVQWTICIFLASGSLLWSVLLKRTSFDFRWSTVQLKVKSYSRRNSVDKKLLEKNGKAFFEKVSSIDLDHMKDDTHALDPSPASKKEQEMALIHIKTH